MEGTSTQAGATALSSESSVAVRSAATLGASLAVTWAIAGGVRLLMPRFLGPEAFGPLNFADAFALTFFVALSFGVDTYIRKEVSIRPEHASDFLGGITVVRVISALVLLGLMQVVLVLTNRPPAVWLLVHTFGLAAFVGAMNLTMAALLHARGTVRALSLVNIVSKLVWAAGTLATVVFHGPLVGVPAALLVSELVKLFATTRLARRNLNLKWRVDPRAVRLVLIASLPLFIHTVAHTIYNKLDVSVVAVLAGDLEVAWYGAASVMAGLTLLISPMISWVLLPLFAKARARSDDEYSRVLRRSLELVLVFAFPTALLMALGAELWVQLFFGAAYAPAAAALRILSPLFILTYVAMLTASSLIVTGRAWAQALVSLGGLAVNPLLNWFFVPHAMRWYGTGGAGKGAAFAQLGTELAVTALMTGLVGFRVFDRRTLGMVGKTVAVCLMVWALDGQLAQTFEPLTRIGLDAVAYATLITLTGAVRLRELVAFAQVALSRRTVMP